MVIPGRHRHKIHVRRRHVGLAITIIPPSRDSAVRLQAQRMNTTRRHRHEVRVWRRHVRLAVIIPPPRHHRAVRLHTQRMSPARRDIRTASHQLGICDPARRIVGVGVGQSNIAGIGLHYDILHARGTDRRQHDRHPIAPRVLNHRRHPAHQHVRDGAKMPVGNRDRVPARVGSGVSGEVEHHAGESEIVIRIRAVIHGVAGRREMPNLTGGENHGEVTDRARLHHTWYRRDIEVCRARAVVGRGRDQQRLCSGVGHRKDVGHDRSQRDRLNRRDRHQDVACRIGEGVALDRFAIADGIDPHVAEARRTDTRRHHHLRRRLALNARHAHAAQGHVRDVHATAKIRAGNDHRIPTGPRSGSGRDTVHAGGWITVHIRLGTSTISADGIDVAAHGAHSKPIARGWQAGNLCPIRPVEPVYIRREDASSSPAADMVQRTLPLAHSCAIQCDRQADRIAPRCSIEAEYIGSSRKIPAVSARDIQLPVQNGR